MLLNSVVLLRFFDDGKMANGSLVVFFVLSCPLAAGVEQLQSAPCAAVQRPPGGGQGHRMVPPPARAAGVRWRHR